MLSKEWVSSAFILSSLSFLLSPPLVDILHHLCMFNLHKHQPSYTLGILWHPGLAFAEVRLRANVRVGRASWLNTSEDEFGKEGSSQNVFSMPKPSSSLSTNVIVMLMLVVVLVVLVLLVVGSIDGVVGSSGGFVVSSVGVG